MTNDEIEADKLCHAIDCLIDRLKVFETKIDRIKELRRVMVPLGTELVKLREIFQRVNPDVSFVGWAAQEFEVERQDIVKYLRYANDPRR